VLCALCSVLSVQRRCPHIGMSPFSVQRSAFSVQPRPSQQKKTLRWPAVQDPALTLVLVVLVLVVLIVLILVILVSVIWLLFPRRYPANPGVLAVGALIFGRTLFQPHLTVDRDALSLRRHRSGILRNLPGIACWFADNPREGMGSDDAKAGSNVDARFGIWDLGFGVQGSGFAVQPANRTGER
jgi:hypothetical protein